jgi:hypothetical protein
MARSYLPQLRSNQVAASTNSMCIVAYAYPELRLAIPLEDAVFVFNKVTVFEASFSNCSVASSFTLMEKLEIAALIPLETQNDNPHLGSTSFGGTICQRPFW